MGEKLYIELMDVYKRKVKTNPAVIKYNKYTEAGIRNLTIKLLDPNVKAIRNFLERKALIKIREYINSDKSGGKSVTYRSLIERLTAKAQLYYFKKQVEENGPIDLNTSIREFFLTNRTYSSAVMCLIDDRTIRQLQLMDLVNFAYNPEFLKIYRIGTTAQDEVKELVKACGHYGISK